MTQNTALRFTLNARVGDQYFVYKSYRFLIIGAVGLEDFYPVSILHISQKALPTDRGACSIEGNTSYGTHRRAFCMKGTSPLRRAQNRKAVVMLHLSVLRAQHYRCHKQHGIFADGAIMWQ